MSDEQNMGRRRRGGETVTTPQSPGIKVDEILEGMTTWLTAAEAAEHAKVSVWTIREAVKAGELPAYAVGRSGRRYRLTAEDVDQWMMSRSWEPEWARPQRL